MPGWKAVRRGMVRTRGCAAISSPRAESDGVGAPGPASRSGAGGAAPPRRATWMPEPRRLSSRPSAESWSRAEITVFREIASSPAKVRIDGRRLSAGIDPPRIRSRSWSQSWRWSGARVRRTQRDQIERVAELAIQTVPIRICRNGPVGGNKVSRSVEGRGSFGRRGRRVAGDNCGSWGLGAGAMANP